MTEPLTRDYRTDEQLFAAINRGDVSAFESLYDRHHRWAFNVAFRFARSEHDAADVVQDAFAYLLQKAPHLKLTARATTYLYPILKHGAIELIRKRNRDLHVSIDAAASLTAPPDVAGENQELASVVSKLPELQREVLLMRYVDGFSQQEIATALAVPVGTVKSRLHHALSRLRCNPELKRLF